MFRRNSDSATPKEGTANSIPASPTLNRGTLRRSTEGSMVQLPSISISVTGRSPRKFHTERLGPGHVDMTTVSTLPDAPSRVTSKSSIVTSTTAANTVVSSGPTTPRLAASGLHGPVTAPAERPTGLAKGLVVRRPRMEGLKIITGGMEEDNTKPQRSNSKREVKRIQKVKDVKEYYSFGDQVMPSCHRGMEIIFGKCRKTGEDVVIKVRVKGRSFSSSTSEQDWRISTEFMLNLPQYEGVASLYEVLEDDQAYIVVMEKVPGKDLFEALCAKDVCDLSEVKEIMRQLLSALKVMHDRGAIHRDLKLENVMFIRTDEEGAWPSCFDEEPDSPKSPGSPGSPSSPVLVKLIDFDTVQHYDPTNRKQTRDVAGTDQYIPAEAYDGVYSPSSDVFAVGVIGYRMLTGRFPFSSKIFDEEPGADNKVGSPHMREIRKKLQEYKVNFQHRAFTEDPQARNLIRWMLSSSESRRPSAQAALEHPWLSGHIGGNIMAMHRSATIGPSARISEHESGSGGADGKRNTSREQGAYSQTFDEMSPIRRERRIRTTFVKPTTCFAPTTPTMPRPLAQAESTSSDSTIPTPSARAEKKAILR